jgi:hypothetical protein
MATLWIEEYAVLGTDNHGRPISAPSGVPTNQQVTISGASAQSSAVQATTRYVRLHSDVACYVKFGTNPTAAADNTSEHLVPGVYIDRAIPTGESYEIAVIAA